MQDAGIDQSVQVRLRNRPIVAETPRASADRAAVVETMARYALCIDAQDWTAHRSLFADTIAVDMQTVNGKPAAYLPADDFIATLAEGFARFAATQHLMGSVMIALDSAPDGSASLGADYVGYVHARHVAKAADAARLDIGGRYTIHMIRDAADRPWTIDRLGLEVLWLEQVAV